MKTRRGSACILLYRHRNVRQPPNVNTTKLLFVAAGGNGWCINVAFIMDSRKFGAIAQNKNAKFVMR